MNDPLRFPPFSRRAFLIGLGGLGLTGCNYGDDDDAANSGTGDDVATGGTGDGSGAPTAQPRVFTHPGLLHTEADFARMREKVAAQAQPWLDGWNALISSGHAQLGASPRVLAQVVRGGTGTNVGQMVIDIHRIYRLALRWKISGDTRYADSAVQFLNAWSGTLTSITGNADRYLAAGLQGYEFANAAEIMRTYDGWAPADLKRFQDMMLAVFYPLSSRFLKEHNGAVITNYWANWDLVNIACLLAVGVLCDRQDIYQEAVDYYHKGQGNGASLQAVYHVHPGYLGQWQESGRDQGHCTLGIGVAGALAEMAWNQGEDFYGHDNSRFLAGAEYVAKSNATDANGAFFQVPYLPYNNKQGYSGGLSPAALGHRRPVWESVLHHYEGRRGIAAPYVKRQAALLRPESGAPSADQLSFGTLTFTRDPILKAAPSGLTARLKGTQIELSWWGTPDGVTYNVKRATRAGGPYSNVASGINDLLTWTDTSASGAVWYVVTAVSASGESAPSNEVTVSTEPTMLLHLAFDEGSGVSAADTTGTWPASKIMRANAWTEGRKQDHAAAFNGTSDFVTLPANVTRGLSDFTIASWVYADATDRFARIFDIGSGPRRSMFLTVRNGTGVVQFTLDVEHGYVAQVVTGQSAFPTGAWTHVAVTLRGPLLTLYVNGVAVGTKTDTVLAPCDLGEGMVGWIGKSQYANDPLLKGKVHDFRIYSGALDASGIAALAVA
ncbi:LamG-like jellyroll fold domain-containing protein [Rhizobacter sp. Root1221]|uniref:LamG-like jellyroll fold domain-containing protein n=1 Tax=Rhizobacter sp. Root1221 TaxID=1736433 RepID=UPI0006F5BEEA|nr:LamG-like jellyroll fold domain-containing protein [Rhizobacter sp. Root1221]KQV94763.1 hypothetical protein ASC87_25985 [Rhizobacter sp. Root1221]